jgi:hypothetical protein
MMAQESVPNFKMRKRKCLNLVGLVVLSVVAVSMAQTDVGRAEAQVPGVVQQKPGKFKFISNFVIVTDVIISQVKN